MSHPHPQESPECLLIACHSTWFNAVDNGIGHGAIAELARQYLHATVKGHNGDHTFGWKCFDQGMGITFCLCTT